MSRASLPGTCLVGLLALLTAGVVVVVIGLRQRTPEPGPVAAPLPGVYVLASETGLRDRATLRLRADGTWSLWAGAGLPDRDVQGAWQQDGEEIRFEGGPAVDSRGSWSPGRLRISWVLRLEDGTLPALFGVRGLSGNGPAGGSITAVSAPVDYVWWAPLPPRAGATRRDARLVATTGAHP